MSESNPTNETEVSITPSARNRSLAPKSQAPAMPSSIHMKLSHDQTVTSTLLSKRFSPTAPEFISGATAHPSRAPVKSVTQDQVNQTWQGGDNGGVLLKPKLTVNTSCDRGPAGKTKERPSFDLQDPPGFHPWSHSTSGLNNPPTNLTHLDHTRQGNSKNIENLPLSAPHLTLKDLPYPACAIDPQEVSVLSTLPNTRHDNLADLSDAAPAHVNFDYRYLHDKAVWNSPPKRLPSISISPRRRDSDSSGLTNRSASASYRSGTADALTSPPASTNIRAHDGVPISSDKGDLPAVLRPDMDGNRQKMSSGTRAAANSSSAVAGAGLREGTNQATSDNNTGFVFKSRGAKARKESARRNKPAQLDPLGKTAVVNAESLTSKIETHIRRKKHEQSKTITELRSIQNTHESGSAIHNDVLQSFADSSNYLQGHAAGDRRNAIQEAEAQDQSLHIIAYNQRLPTNGGASRDDRTMGFANLAASGTQLQSVLPYTTMSSVPVNTGGSGGQQQSAAPHSIIGSANIGASGAYQQLIPPYPTEDPTHHSAILPKNVLAIKLISGQKYSIKPGFKGSTTLWPFDGVTEDQLYLCSVGEDGSVILTPTSSAYRAPMQSSTILSSGQQRPHNGPAERGSPRHSLPDFGPIGPPNQGHIYGAAPRRQSHNMGLSHPSNSRIEVNQEGSSQLSNAPPSWGLPRSPIRAHEWSLPVPQGLPVQLQQGPYSYSSPSNLSQLTATQLEKSHRGRAESGTTHIWTPSQQQQYAGPKKDSEKPKENLSFTPIASGPPVPHQHQLMITEISNVSPRALVPRSATAWTASASSPNITGPLLSGVYKNSWETPAGKGMSPMTSSPALPLVPYRQFLDMTFPQAQGGHHGVFGHQVLRNGKPTYEVAISPEFLPFFEATKSMKPAEWGVVKIGSIPYACTKQDILAFLGKNAKIITPELGPAIHIMMDRTSGKTLDAYVEFLSPMDAQAFVNKLLISKEMEHRQIKVADRHCMLEVSSQAALMKELFPKAKNVEWNGMVPVISQPGPEVPFNSGFKCFITREELLTLAKHAESPHRSGCSSKSATRTYENIISILYKFPWFAVKHYTLGDRDAIYEAVKRQLSTLATALQKAACQRAADPRMPPSELTEDLLSDLLQAGLKAPGFSEQQKWHLWQGLLPFSQRIARVSTLSEIWPWLALSKTPGRDEDIIRVYARIHWAAFMDPAGNPAGFGPLFQAGATMLEMMDQECSMEEVGAMEWQALECILRRVLE